jgi:hypothetical protein
MAQNGPALFQRRRQAATAAQGADIPGVQSTHVRTYSVDFVRRFVLELNVTDDVAPAAHTLESLKAAHSRQETDHTGVRTPPSIGALPLRGHLPPAPGDASTGNIFDALRMSGAQGSAAGDAEGALPDFVDVMDDTNFDLLAGMASRSHMSFRLLHSKVAAAAEPPPVSASQALHTEDLHDTSRLEAHARRRPTAPLAGVYDELETLYHCVLRRTARDNSRGTPSQHDLTDVPHLYRVPGNHTAESNNGRECFLHLTSLMAQLNATDLETYAAPRLQTGSNASSVLIDALFELASPAAQSVVSHDLLMLKDPNVHLVSRALHAVVYLDVPELTLVEAVERLAFHAAEDGRARGLRSEELMSDSLLALGTLVRRLYESGRCLRSNSSATSDGEPCQRLLTRIQAELLLGASREPLHHDSLPAGSAAGDYLHARYRRMPDGVRLATPATEEDLRRHTRHSVVLEALGNSGHASVVSTLLSHAQAGEHAPLSVRDAALHALRHYDHPAAEEELVRHALVGEHRQLRRTARAAYAARNRELSLDIVEAAAADLRARTLHNMTLPRDNFYATSHDEAVTPALVRGRRDLVDSAVDKFAELLSFLNFDLVLPGVDWRKTWGVPSAIGAGAGIIIQNEARFLQVGVENVAGASQDCFSLLQCFTPFLLHD